MRFPIKTTSRARHDVRHPPAANCCESKEMHLVGATCIDDDELLNLAPPPVSRLGSQLEHSGRARTEEFRFAPSLVTFTLSCFHTSTSRRWNDCGRVALIRPAGISYPFTVSDNSTGSATLRSRYRDSRLIFTISDIKQSIACCAKPCSLACGALKTHANDDDS